MAPSLKIPVRLDMDTFRQNVSEARSKVGEATDFMVKQLEKTAAKSAVFDLPRLIQNNDSARQITQKAVQAISTDLGRLTAGSINSLPIVIERTAQQLNKLAPVFDLVLLPAAKGFAESLLPLAVRAAAVYAGWKLISSVVAEARDELSQMLDIANKAQNVGLKPEAFQAFTSAVDTGAEDALKQFFQAQKDVLSESVSPDALEVEKVKWSELTIAIREARFELGATTGPETFLHAAGTDAQVASTRLLGVLQTMKELNESGQKLAAVNLASKAFGAGFADDIRRGKIDIDSVADSLNDQLVKGLQDSSTFSNELVTRTKELHDQLDAAHLTISQNLRPAWQDLDEIALKIEEIWVHIVQLMATASGYVPGAGPQTSELEQKKTALADIEKQIAQTKQDLAAVPNSWFDTLLDRAPMLAQHLDDLEKKAAKLREQIGALTPPKIETPDVPLPPRRPVDIPEPEKKTKKKNEFQSEIDSLDKRIAGFNAEAAAVGKTTEVKARYYANDQLIAALNRAHIAINPQLAQTIGAIADSYGRAAQKAEDAKNKFQGIQDAAAFFGHSLENALSNLNSQTKGIDLLRSAVGDLSRELIRAAITGEGAFAKILGTASTTGGAGGLAGLIAGLFRADGGPIGLANGGGGPFRGRGTSRSDSNLVFLSDGEYVVNAAAAKHYRAMLDQINFGYANGGPIAPAPMSVPAPFMSRGGDLGQLIVRVVPDDEKFNAYVEDGAGRVVARSAPGIGSSAVAASRAGQPDWQQSYRLLKG